MTTLATQSRPDFLAAPDFGHDLACDVDLADDMLEADGFAVLGQAIFRRLSTPRGTLWQDRDYGLDLRDYLSRRMTVAEIGAIPGDVVAEIRKDQRVELATATIVRQTQDALDLWINVQTADGPFSLVISATAALVTLASVTPGVT